MFFKDWQIAVLDPYFKGRRMGSRDAWRHVNEESDWGSSGGSISRASVHNFLESLTAERLMDYDEVTGRGGRFKVYKMSLTKDEFQAQIMKSSR